MSGHVPANPAGDPLAALMAAAQQGDRAAYECLLRLVLPRLRARLRRLLRDADEAEEAVQDTLLAVHRARHSFDPARPFMPWLVAIAHRRAADRQSRQIRRRRYEIVPPAEREFPDPAQLAESPFGAVAARQLRQAIDRLPPGQAQAVRLMKLADASLAEASAMTGISVGALKVATHRAVGGLRRLLAPAEIASRPSAITVR